MFLTVQEWLSPSLISVANGQTERDTTIVLCLIPARFLTSPPIPEVAMSRSMVANLYNYLT
jgi:hypothetical protein